MMQLFNMHLIPLCQQDALVDTFIKLYAFAFELWWKKYSVAGCNGGANYIYNTEEFQEGVEQML